MERPAAAAAQARGFRRDIKTGRCRQIRDPQYVAKMCSYVSKDKDTMGEALANGGSAGHAARLLLRNSQPGECEMTDALAHGGPWLSGCATKHVRTGRPDEMEEDAWWVAYRARPAEQEEMNFLEWHRIHRQPDRPYVRRKCSMTAAVIHFGSMRSDSFYGQWLTAFCACRSAAELLVPEAARLPPERRWFYSAWRRRPDIWGTDAGVRRWMLAEQCHTPAFLRAVAWRGLCAFLLSRPWRPGAQRRRTPQRPLDPDQRAAVETATAAAAAVCEDGEGAAVVLTGEAGVVLSRSSRSWYLASLARCCLCSGSCSKCRHRGDQLADGRPDGGCSCRLSPAKTRTKPLCRELLHLPTSHANLSKVTSPANFSCQLVESYFTCLLLMSTF